MSEPAPSPAVRGASFTLRQIQSFLSSASLWASAILLACLPFIVAADFGGALRWTQYIASIAIMICVLLALPAIRKGENSGHIRQLALLAPLMIWLAFAWFQTIPLAPTLVESLSPASYNAYTEWTSGLLPAGESISEFPISLAVHDSRHAMAILAMLVPLCWAASMVFYSRARITLLLHVAAIGGATLAAFGIARMAFPHADLFDFTSSSAGASFATFVNRNNASLMLNLGLGASLGLLSWRLTALTGQQVDDEQFEFNDLFALIGERESAIGMFSAALCSAGLLASGSRGGLVAALAGGLLAFGWVRRRRGFISIPVVGSTIAVAVFILVVPLRINLASIKRLNLLSENANTILNDGRFRHWPEGWDAALAHFPLGSGLSTYGFAYRPFQHAGLPSWCEHADNLWLELFTEQGILGVILAVSVLLILIRSLVKLADSPDPLDHGVQTVGWYALGVIVVSQAFDFGLIVPANLFLVTILVSAIVVRSMEAGTFLSVDDSAEPKISFLDSISDTKPISRFRSKLFVAAPLVAVLLCVVFLPALRRDASIEGLVRRAKLQTETDSTNVLALTELSQELAPELSNDPPPELINAVASVEYHRARMEEVKAARPETVEQAAEYYQATGPTARRMLNRIGVDRSTDSQIKLVGLRRNTKNESYRRAFELYTQAIRKRPLDLTARAHQLYLDFLNQDQSRTALLLGQLKVLYRNNPEQLTVLGGFAADSSEKELACEFWRSALTKDQNLTPRVLAMVREHDDIGVREVIPEIPKAVRIAAKTILHRDDRDSFDYLGEVIDGIACDQCVSVQEKASCHELGGDIGYALGQNKRAFTEYARAVALTPKDGILRMKMVRRLRESGHQREALICARIGRRLIPEDVRFDEFIKKMAQEDLENLRLDPKSSTE